MFPSELSNDVFRTYFVFTFKSYLCALFTFLFALWELVTRVLLLYINPRPCSAFRRLICDGGGGLNTSSSYYIPDPDPEFNGRPEHGAHHDKKSVVPDLTSTGL